MSPSRGKTTTASASTDLTPTETHAALASSSALTHLSQNLHYLFAPSTSPQPARFRTRALLRSLNYFTKFIFWRVVRYAKYAAVASLVTAVSATAFGGFVSGIGWIVAPTGIVASVGLGLVWAVGKWVFRKARVTQKVGVAAEMESVEQWESVKRTGQFGDVSGPEAIAW